jgi:signal transduction histidine kinase
MIAPMQTARILVVEDDPNLLEGIRAILELDQYLVVSAENGAQALDWLRNAAALPDLILSDIMMPQMDGMALLNAIRSEPQWVAIPFIFLTAKGDKVDMQRGKQLGADDYLVKPFDADDLLIAVEARLKRQRALNDAQTDSINSLKRNILSILNHEFRTPLTFIVAYADMLNNPVTTQDLSDTELLGFLKGVSSGASRLRRLIENFILLVELQTGDAERTFEWRRSQINDMAQLLQTVCDRTILVSTPDRPYQIEVQGDLPPFVADREYLMIALAQLVNNAIKFSPPNTPIILGARAANGEISLSVTDYGRGIPEAEIAAIWETFYQVNRAHHEDQGTGSGLAIVQGIARMHGGRVHVESEAGVGSTFTIILPL